MCYLYFCFGFPRSFSLSILNRYNSDAKSPSEGEGEEDGAGEEEVEERPKAKKRKSESSAPKPPSKKKKGVCVCLCYLQPWQQKAKDLKTGDGGVPGIRQNSSCCRPCQV